MFRHFISRLTSNHDPLESEEHSQEAIEEVESPTPGAGASDGVFAEDRIIANLPEHFHKARKPADPNDYNFLRTIGEKYGLPDDFIRDRQARYAKAIRKQSLFVSQPDEFPGLRRLIITEEETFGKELYGNMKASTEASKRYTIAGSEAFGEELFGVTEDSTTKDPSGKPRLLIGVTDDGLLFSGLFTCREDDQSIADILRDIRNGSLQYEPCTFPFFTINKYSTGYRNSAFMMTCEPLKSICGEDIKNPAVRKFNKTCTAVMTSRALRRLNLIRHAITTALDPEVLRLMRSTQRTYLSDASWFSGMNVELSKESPRHAGDNKINLDDRRIVGVSVDAMNVRANMLARVQAVRSFPLFAEQLIGSHTARIDQRHKLIPALAEFNRVSEMDIRKLQGVTWQRAGTRPSHALSLLHDYSNVPVHAKPGTRKEFEAINRIGQFSIVYGNVETAFKAFCKGGSPYRYMNDLARISASDVRDALEYVSSKLLVPIALRGFEIAAEQSGIEPKFQMYSSESNSNIVSLALGMTYKEMPPKDLFSISDRWHRNLARYEQNLITYNHSVEWQSLISVSLVGKSGIKARELNSSIALTLQGRAEGHCVGGYADKVLRSGSQIMTLIFSLEDDSGTIGTVEISGKTEKKIKDDTGKNVDPSGNGFFFDVIQNRGKSNSDPGLHAERAARDLCKLLSSLTAKQLETYLDGISTASGLRDGEKILPHHLRTIGYNPWDDGALELAWEELSELLPRKVRKIGLMGLIDHYSRLDEASSYRHTGYRHVFEISRVNDTKLDHEYKFGPIPTQELADLDDHLDERSRFLDEIPF